MIRAVIADRALTPEAIAAIRASIDKDEMLIVQRPLVSDIATFVAQETGVSREELMRSASRTAGLARLRSVVSYLAHRHGQRSASEIGRVMGGRDHTTILAHLNLAHRYLRTDPDYRALVERGRRRFAIGGVQ